MLTNIREDYFEWMLNLACGDLYAKQISFKKLLTHLHTTEFKYIIPRDRNRAEDGICLRRRYILDNGLEYMYDQVIDALYGPCSILEMMVALALRCEEDYADDPGVGDRSRQWFWSMIRSLGLSGMTDMNYDFSYVEMVLDRFVKRQYEPDGRGGLFTIKNCRYDLREWEIWYQLGWYLETIV